MSAPETPFTFACRDETLFGILHPSESASDLGVVVVVGGPQYRVGSHRQFVLLARGLAEAGLPTLRYDYRGMGDSDGAFRDFEQIDTDIAAAVDALVAAHPNIKRVVLWGLCDAASAILFYARNDPRVAGVVLLNPWVRTEEGLAKARMKHYYAGRLFSADLWKRVLSGKVDWSDSLRSLAGSLKAIIGGRKSSGAGSSSGGSSSGGPADDGSLPDRMAAGFEAFDGPVLMILSGNDLTAQEFVDAATSSPRWKSLMGQERVARADLPAADHTFSRRDWRDEVTALTRDWLKETFG